jgi:predicted dithiol-disulfide oxidoreductase (DUF899 family)
MTLPQVVLRERWLEARSQYLAEEKELIRRRDVPNAGWRGPPMVWIKKNYRWPRLLSRSKRRLTCGPLGGLTAYPLSHC